MGKVRAGLAVNLTWRETLSIEQDLEPDEVAAGERHRRRSASNGAGGALFLRRGQVGVKQGEDGYR